ncbi:hypothetical protein NTE_00673 [Candidatus Nitrososphaera evergladensis SR1]|jgi:hypothetical protein|uniref:PRC-barrel domain-containing protein n=1 Tax=Candidatus Nitrososphaera evergladensis SR1 TaxID=1459636 RepID=A0A075MNG5_9ARCH|nr:DUF2171 domain-containing protein [Candidatus Nitrososphaera evergladensis]AIF82753.1 hypothetical protein NTE_00673 [Candidatus Nitrososphaera evergladensis SR1]
MTDDVTSYVDWSELKGKEARGTQGDVDLGEVRELGRNYIVTQKGRVSREKFYIPKYLAVGYDGHTVYFNVTEAQTQRFSREAPPSYEEYAQYRVAHVPPDIETRVHVIKSRRTVDPTRESPVLDWDSIVHKNVRAADGEPVGSVVAVLGDAIHVETQGSRSQFLIPKERVQGFDGAEVRLDAPVSDLGQYARPGP